MRTRAERRHTDWRKAIRKKHISDSYSCWGNTKHWYQHLHQYSKNKIHCSCPMCSAKTNNKHRSGARGWEPSYNPNMHDKRNDLFMQDSENEYFEDDCN